jgi:hypothetical protein
MLVSRDMHRLAFAIVVTLAAQTAHAEPRCIGPAFPGAYLGAGAGGLLVIGSLELAGYDFGHASHPDAIIAGSMIGGAIAGPIAACAMFSNERHTIPAASFVVGGAIVGGASFGAATYLALRPSSSCGPNDRHNCDIGEAVTLGVLSLAVGSVAGGFAGYYLHVRVFGNEQPIVTPIASPGVAGLSLAGRF